MKDIFDNIDVNVVEDDTLPPRSMVLDLPDITVKELLGDSKPKIYNSYEEAFGQLKLEVEFVCQVNCKDESIFWIMNLAELFKENQKLNKTN